MANKDEIILEKIARILSSAYEDGIDLLLAASYLTGRPRNLTREDLSKLSKYMLSSNITVQQIEKFIDQTQYDILDLVKQVQKGTWKSTGIEIEEEVMEKENVEKVDMTEEDVMVAEDVRELEEDNVQENAEEDVEQEGVEQEDVEQESDLEEEEETIELTEKAKKLQEKIDLLCEKVEQEKSPLKRHMLTFQIKMLNSKIQKEIDIQNIQAKYDYKRQMLGERKQRIDDTLIDNIASLDKAKKNLKKVLKGNEEYDYQSENFLYPKEYVEEAGGIEKFSDRLKQSEKETTQQVADRIAKMAEVRQELDAINEDIRAYKEELRNSNSNYEKRMDRLDNKEKALVLANKTNIFTRVGKFFGTMVEEVKSYWQDRKESKQINKQENQELNAIEEETKKAIEELKKQQEEKKQEIKLKYKEQKEEMETNKAKDVAAQFRSSHVVPPEEMLEATQTQETDEPTVNVAQEQDGDELEQ